MFEGFKIYGPYLRYDGRKHVVLVDRVTKKKTTMSYPKYLYQITHNVILEPGITVDHLDRDYTNDTIENLVIRTLVDHATLDSKRVRLVKADCQWCGKGFERSGGQMDHNSVLGKAGPFCGRSCAGKYGKSVELTGIKLPVAQRVLVKDREYFYLDK